MPLSISRSLNKNVYESLDHSSGPFGRNLDESLTPEGEERQAAEMKKQAAEAAAQKSQQEYDNAFPLLGNGRPAPAPVERPATQSREKYDAGDVVCGLIATSRPWPRSGRNRPRSGHR
jgi:hypothetical protein